MEKKEKQRNWVILKVDDESNRRQNPFDDNAVSGACLYKGKILFCIILNNKKYIMCLMEFFLLISAWFIIITINIYKRMTHDLMPVLKAFEPKM